MRYNVHVLIHLPKNVYNLGPLWTFSAFHFESNNHFLNQNIQAANRVIEEASTKILLYQNKFLGKNLKMKKQKFIQHIDGIKIHCKPKKIILTDYDKKFWKGINSDLLEVRSFTRGNEYFEKLANRKKLSDDSHVVLTNEKFGEIKKILICNGKVYIFVLIKYNVVPSDANVKYLERRNQFGYHCVRPFHIYSKAIFMEDENCFSTYPNLIEYD